jgi:dihydroxyacid dehydratase/phosphogluconate dehydratase
MIPAHRDSRLIEILAFLLKNKLIDGDNMTVTGCTLGENLEQWTHKFGELDFQQDLIRPLDNPIKSSGHIRLIYIYSGSKEVFFYRLALEY